MASLPDFRDYARNTMSQSLFAQLDSSAGNQITKKLNEEDFERIKLKQRGMANLKYFVGPEAYILGHKVSTPIGLGTVPRLKRFHFEGEVACAQAAKEFGVVYTLDVANTSVPLEDIFSESKGGLKILRLCPLMPADALKKVITLIGEHADVIGTVLDFNVTAKIDSQTGSDVKFKPPQATWTLTDIGKIKSATKKPVIV